MPDVVLFPDVRLPLHIFEPRYRAMTRDALDGAGAIGLVLLQPDAHPGEAHAPIFETGCIGRIVEHEELPDGRFMLVLEGERRFRIACEDDADTPYRSVRAELLPDPSFDALDDATRFTLTRARGELESRMLSIARAHRPDAERLLAQRMRALDPIALLHAIAFGLDCGPLEKQGLLEAPDPLSRAHLLGRLFEFREAESQLSFTPKNVN